MCKSFGLRQGVAGSAWKVASVLDQAPIAQGSLGGFYPVA